MTRTTVFSQKMDVRNNPLQINHSLHADQSPDYGLCRLTCRALTVAAPYRILTCFLLTFPLTQW